MLSIQQTKTFPWPKTGNKACFVTSYIGSDEMCDINITPSPRMSEYDYLCFTNITNPSLLDNKNWTIIRIQDLPNFKKLKVIDHNVRISRYFKFNFKTFLNKYCRDFQNYEIVFWNDCTKYPKKSTIWKTLIHRIKKHRSGIIQYKWPHRGEKGISVIEELRHIARCQKDTRSNVNNTIRYLKNLDPYINLTKKQYYENSCFGYHLRNPNTNALFTGFWKHYLNCPTFRDQPLWNFMYLSKKLNPAIDNKLNHYYLESKRKLTRNNYTNKVIL